MTSPQETRPKTSFDTLADIIILIKDKPGDVPKTKAKALRWVKSKFPEATDRAICIAFNKCCISFKKSRKKNARTGLRGLASKRDVGELWAAIAAMNQMIFHFSEEVENQIGAAPNALRSSTISTLSDAVAVGYAEFLERASDLMDDKDTEDQDPLQPHVPNALKGNVRRSLKDHLKNGFSGLGESR